LENQKRFKKGEIVFKEGDSSDTIYIIQSGRLALSVDRGGKKFEVTQLGTMQLAGEQALNSNAKQAFTAEAMQETKILEIPAEVLKLQIEKSTPGIKLLVKSLVEETRQTRQLLRTVKSESEKSPCPQISIPRIFSLLNLVARHTGRPSEMEKTRVEVDWSILKLYTARLFAESPQRMRSLLDLLAKLGQVTLTVSKNEDGEEELTKVLVHNIQFIEDFAEFYQYNLYKGGKSEIIYVDPLAHKVAKALSQTAANAEVNHKGAVTLLFDAVTAELKKNFRLDLKTTHFDVLEKKGLFINRLSSEKGISLQFDKTEFARISAFWSVILEIDKWNEKGFVDLKEPDEALSGGAAAEGCPQCSAVILPEHKFCPGCGLKLAA
jgi:hypothetical protein